MDKHTPGPWEIEVGPEFADRPNRHPYHDNRLIVGDRTIVARMTDHPQQRANARLIAAAPDLLDACRAIAALADGQGRLNMLQVAAAARDAIAKATGQEA